MILCGLLLLCPMAMDADEEEHRTEKLIHISEETPQMIHFRSLMIDGCLSRMKYHIMYDNIDDEMKDNLIKEIDYIWYQLGINPLKTS